MAIINANEISRGNCIVVNGDIYAIIDKEHTQPGKGGAFIQVETKRIKDGTKVMMRFRSTEAVEKAYLAEKKLQYLYSDSTEVHLMDQESYESLTLPLEMLGKQAAFLSDGMTLNAQYFNDSIVTVKLPEKVVSIVEWCEPVIKGQTATSSYKQATLDNGVNISVPPFIASGDKIIVDLDRMEYVERFKE